MMKAIMCPFCDEEIEMVFPFLVDENSLEKQGYNKKDLLQSDEMKLNFSVFAHLAEDHTLFDFMDYVKKSNK